MSVLILCRHAEAQKNMRQTIGGAGSPLTSHGNEQAQLLGAELAKLDLTNPTMLVANRKQCIDTAHIVGRFLKAEIRGLTLPSFDLGVADGLSEREFHQRYPADAERLRRWRAGEIDIRQLALPGGADPIAYYHLGLQFINELRADTTSSSIVIATRSILVLLSNALSGNSPSRPGAYKEVPWAHSAWAKFTL
jgi:broad specificity phosphatase PhoE